MDISINQALTTVFFLLFGANIVFWLFRVLGNRASNDYKHSVEDRKNLVDIENISLLELARLYHGELHGEDVAPLLVSWARHGYAKLIFRGKSGGQIEIFLKKLGNLPENAPEAERAIFDCLFNKGEDRVVTRLKLDDPRIDPDKLARLQDSSNMSKLDAFNSELSTKFSLLIKEIGQKQKRFMDPNQAAYCRLTLLEIFIGLSSLFMLGCSFSFLVDGQVIGTGEFYVYAGLGLLLTAIYFGALYRLGRAFSFANFLGYLGVGFLIYLAVTAIESGYRQTGNLFFKNSYRYYGFVFGSLLALLAPTARAISDYGRRMRDFFRTRRETVLEEARNQERFLQLLPEMMLYGCAAVSAKRLELQTPDWYEGPAEIGDGKIDPVRFSDHLEHLGRELHLLAIVRR
ncbi:MAG: hypothetical protein Kow0029_29870 [Candidatus Rifleibacteriota bacterium]